MAPQMQGQIKNEILIVKSKTINGFFHHSQMSGNQYQKDQAYADQHEH